MAGNWITIDASDGSGSFRAYLALPRSGKGPGIVVAQEIFGINPFIREVADRYAEEGYVVLAPDLFWRQQPGIDLGYTPDDWKKAFELYQGFDQDKGVKDIAATMAALRQRPEFVGKVGVIGFCLGGKLAYLAACRTDAAVSVGYYGVGIESDLDEFANIRGRLVLHIAAEDGFCPPEARDKILAAAAAANAASIAGDAGHAGHAGIETHVYPGVDHAFARTGGEHFDKPAAQMAQLRTIAALRRELGPHYDLSALWDKHCEYEFGTRNVDDTMATMVAEPYVNHIPTMTGGVGHQQLKRFYTHHFVNGNPPDTMLIPISRTVGATQVVDELLFCFTHTTEIDWMLPGVRPTGKRVEVPLVAIIQFRGDKLAHEHIYWDQASVLAQIGLLDASKLPVAGVETARKLVDETLPSNTLMAAWAGSEGKPV